MLVQCIVPIIENKTYELTIKTKISHVDRFTFIEQLKVYMDGKLLWLSIDYDYPVVYDDFNTKIQNNMTLIEYVEQYFIINENNENSLLCTIKNIH